MKMYLVLYVALAYVPACLPALHNVVGFNQVQVGQERTYQLAEGNLDSVRNGQSGAGRTWLTFVFGETRVEATRRLYWQFRSYVKRAWKTEETTAEKAPVAKCDCEDCDCPPGVCRDGNCKKNYVILLTSRFCQPCAKVQATLIRLKEQGYITYSYDVDRFKKVVKRFDATATPTVVVMDQGKETKRWVGAVSEEELKEHLKTKTEQTDDYLLGRQ